MRGNLVKKDHLLSIQYKIPPPYFLSSPSSLGDIHWICNGSEKRREYCIPYCHSTTSLTRTIHRERERKRNSVTTEAWESFSSSSSLPHFIGSLPSSLSLESACYMAMVRLYCSLVLHSQYSTSTIVQKDIFGMNGPYKICMRNWSYSRTNRHKKLYGKSMILTYSSILL